MYVCVHVFACACAHMHVYACACMHVCTYMHMCVCMYANVRAPVPALVPRVTMATRDRSKVFIVKAKAAGLGLGRHRWRVGGRTFERSVIRYKNE